MHTPKRSVITTQGLLECLVTTLYQPIAGRATAANGTPRGEDGKGSEFTDQTVGAEELTRTVNISLGFC